MNRMNRRQFIRAAGGTLLAAPAFAAFGGRASRRLHAGFGESDITPPIGAHMTGEGLVPSVGVDDPLMARAFVAQAGGRTLAIVGLDLVKIPRVLADAAIAAAARRTGISPEAILVCATHNHSSPFIPPGGPKNHEYLAGLPDRIANSIVQAYNALQPARMYIGRTLVYEGLHNRRLVSKATGTVINTWLPNKLNDLGQTPQLLGPEGPIDPEMWAVRFNALNGRVLGVLVNFACVPNLHDRIRRRRWSADYPGVIAERMKHSFGKDVVTVFTLGAAGNVNPNKPFAPGWRKRAEVFAKAAVAAADGVSVTHIEEPVAVDYVRRNVHVQRRNSADQPAKRAARGAPLSRVLEVPVSAARIGPLGIATNAGELFVEWGLSIKKRSPFPHTIIGEMTNAAFGYEPTAAGFRHGGYEALPTSCWVSLEGIQTLVNTAVDLLQKLWKRRIAAPGNRGQDAAKF